MLLWKIGYNVHIQLSSELEVVFGLSVYGLPFFLYASSEGSDKAVIMCRLV